MGNQSREIFALLTVVVLVTSLILNIIGLYYVQDDQNVFEKKFCGGTLIMLDILIIFTFTFSNSKSINDIITELFLVGFICDIMATFIFILEKRFNNDPILFTGCAGHITAFLLFIIFGSYDECEKDNTSKKNR